MRTYGSCCCSLVNQQHWLSLLASKVDLMIGVALIARAGRVGALEYVVTVTLLPCGKIIDHGMEGSMHWEKHEGGAL
jgi:hypothetical protein